MLPSHRLQPDDCGCCCCCCCCCVFLLTPPPGTYEWSRSVLSWKSQSLNFPMVWLSFRLCSCNREIRLGDWLLDGLQFFSIFWGEWVPMRNEKPIFCLGGKSEVDYCCWRCGGEARGYQPAKMIKKGGVMVYHSLGPPTDRKANIINAFWVT